MGNLVSKTKESAREETDLTRCRVPAVVCPYHRQQHLQQQGGLGVGQGLGLTRALSGPSLHRAAVYQRNYRHSVKGTTLANSQDIVRQTSENSAHFHKHFSHV